MRPSNRKWIVNGIVICILCLVILFVFMWVTA